MNRQTVCASLCACMLAVTAFASPSVALAESEVDLANEEAAVAFVADEEDPIVGDSSADAVTEDAGPDADADAIEVEEAASTVAGAEPSEADAPEFGEAEEQADGSGAVDEEALAADAGEAEERPEDVALEAAAEAPTKHADGWFDETSKDGKKGRVYYRDGEKLTGYQKIDGSHYYLDDTTGFMVSAATHLVNGKLALFGENGARVTGEGWKSVKGTWYFLDSGSVVHTGWLKSGGAWYFLDGKTGAMKSNESFLDDGKRYVANASGICLSNAWVKVGKSWYLTDSSSAVRSGWAKVSGDWYYLDPKAGVMKSGEIFKVDGTTYVAKTSGVCPVNGWVQINGAWYLTNGWCAMRTGWAQSGSTWYYLDPKTSVMKSNTAFVLGGKTYVATASGACPANEWVKVGNAWYLTDSSCAARTGWAQVGSTWYYLSPSKDKAGVQGKMMTGLIQVGGKSYFLTSSGAMAANRFVKLSDGTERYANADGSLGGIYRKNGVYYNPNGSVASGWLKDGSKWYYIDPKSGRATTGWLKVGGKWYWFDSNGVMVTGERTINGKKEYFEDSGAWIDVEAVRKAIVNAAYSQIGAAYTEANDYYEKDVAFNCSGFSYWCYKEAGYIVPRKQGYYSYYWNENNKEYSQMWWVEKRGNWTTNVSNLNPGDLVFFSPINDKYHTGHVGVYVGGSMMIDAFPGYGVSKRSVYQSGFVGGGSPIF